MHVCEEFFNMKRRRRSPFLCIASLVIYVRDSFSDCVLRLIWWKPYLLFRQEKKNIYLKI